MTCDNRCEIVIWEASNPHLVKEVAPPNVSIDDAKLLAMATEQIIKENTSRTAVGCASGCECMQVDRIDNDTFGICEKCDEEISLKRLEVRPVTTQCIDCKAKEEAYEKALGL